jgi:hypothetical protein
MNRILLVALLLLPLAAEARQIVITMSADLSSAVVEAGTGIHRLVALDDRINDALTLLTNSRRSYRGIEARKTGTSFGYRVQLDHSATQWPVSRWHHPLRITDWQDLLLVPESWSMTQPFELLVRVPDGIEVFLPFTLVDQQPGAYRYRVYPLLPGHGGLALFGNLVSRQRNGADGTVIRISVVGEPGKQTDALFGWVTDVINVAGEAHRTLPGHDASIVIVPVPFVNGVIPWAHVRRGGGSHVIAYVKQDADQVELARDWTLFHELAHLYHPYLKGGGRWISEGFASYYQNVYRAQAGVVDPDYAWQRLQAGLARGRKENAERGNPRVTEGGRMRTYWTGAALALEADSQLRSEFGMTLGELMGKFASKHLPAQGSWYARDYLRGLDEEAGGEVLIPLYERYLRDRFFPSPVVDVMARKMIFNDV